MKTPTKINRVSALLLVTLGVGCDFSKQLTAKTVTVSTVLTTPAVDLPAGALAGNGLDAGFSFDGSFAFDAGFDAGALLSDAGLRVPSQNLVAVFFGQRQGDNLDVAPAGIAGVTVTLDEVGGGSWPLRDEGGGSYALVDAGFVYKEHATYNFTMRRAGTTYVAEVADVPPRELIAQFHQAPGYLTLQAGEPLSFNRIEPASGVDRPLGFVSVFPLSAQGTQGQPTYTNVPKTPLEFLKLVVAPNDWLKTTVTIPGTAFPEKDHNYVIVLQSAKRGGPKSDNLFAGSAILAGTAEIGIVKTRP